MGHLYIITKRPAELLLNGGGPQKYRLSLSLYPLGFPRCSAGQPLITLVLFILLFALFGMARLLGATSQTPTELEIKIEVPVTTGVL